MVRDLAEAEHAARADVVERPLAAAVFAADAAEAGADHVDAVEIIAFPHDHRFVGAGGFAILGQPLVSAGPVVIAVGFQLRRVAKFLVGGIVEVVEKRVVAEECLQRVFPVNLVDPRLEGRIVFHDVAQAFPCELKKAGDRRGGDDRGGARHPAERGNFPEHAALTQLRGLRS